MLVCPYLEGVRLLDALQHISLGHVLDFLGAQHGSDFLHGLGDGLVGQAAERHVAHHRLLRQGCFEARDEHEATVASLRDDAGEQGSDLHFVAPLCCSVCIVAGWVPAVYHCYISPHLAHVGEPIQGLQGVQRTVCCGIGFRFAAEQRGAAAREGLVLVARDAAPRLEARRPLAAVLVELRCGDAGAAGGTTLVMHVALDHLGLLVAVSLL